MEKLEVFGGNVVGGSRGGQLCCLLWILILGSRSRRLLGLLRLGLGIAGESAHQGCDCWVCCIGCVRHRIRWCRSRLSVSISRWRIGISVHCRGEEGRYRCRSRRGQSRGRNSWRNTRSTGGRRRSGCSCRGLVRLRHLSHHLKDGSNSTGRSCWSGWDRRRSRVRSRIIPLHVQVLNMLRRAPRRCSGFRR